MNPLQEADPSLPHRVLDLPAIDQIGFGLVTVFALLGIWRGLWWQVIRLLGVVLAVVLARTLTPRLEPAFEGVVDLTPAVSYGVVWALVFLGGLVFATLFGLIGKRALEAMQLGLVDRAGGAVVGLLTGLVLHAALLVMMSFVGNAEWTAGVLEGSRSRLVLEHLALRRSIILDARAAETISEPWAERWDAPPE